MREPKPSPPENPPNTLQPIRSDGRSVLDTHDVAGMTGAKLKLLDIAWSNVTLDVTSIEGDDLLAQEAHITPPRIPKRGNLLHALFALLFIGSLDPVMVHVTPEEIRFDGVTDHAGARDWLAKRHFTSLIDFAKKVSVLILAIGSMLAPVPDDDDTDNDDDDHKIHAGCVT